MHYMQDLKETKEKSRLPLTDNKHKNLLKDNLVTEQKRKRIENWPPVSGDEADKN